MLPGLGVRTIMEKQQIDWDPRSEPVQKNQIAAYDQMRARCPVAHSAYGNWTVFRHEDAVRILDDHETFSNVVSAHLSVPSGMDPPEHTPFRRSTTGTSRRSGWPLSSPPAGPFPAS
jgi:cytochrome P450